MKVRGLGKERKVKKKNEEEDLPQEALLAKLSDRFNEKPNQT